MDLDSGLGAQTAASSVGTQRERRGVGALRVSDCFSGIRKALFSGLSHQVHSDHAGHSDHGDHHGILDRGRSVFVGDPVQNTLLDGFGLFIAVNCVPLGTGRFARREVWSVGNDSHDRIMGARGRKRIERNVGNFSTRENVGQPPCLVRLNR